MTSIRNGPGLFQSGAGEVASVAKLLVQSGLFWESLKRAQGLPLAEIDGRTVEHFHLLSDDPAAHEEIATRIALWAGAGFYHRLQAETDDDLVEQGLRALLKPISEGA